MAVLHNRQEQLDFALKRLDHAFRPNAAPLVLVQYSDNRPWVEEQAVPPIRALLPAADLILRPLSLTSGAHMGPGTWAVAFLPELQAPTKH